MTSLAMVPDEAIERSHEISPSAFRLYCHYCRHRNKKSQDCFPSLKQSSEVLKMAYTYVSEMRHQLASRGWIQIKGNTIIPLIGFGISEPEPSEKPNPTFGKTETKSRAIPEKPKRISEKPKDDFGKTESVYKEEPAQLTSPLEPLPSGAIAPNGKVSVEPWYGMFAERYQNHYEGMAYKRGADKRTGDFVQLTALLKSQAEWMTPEKWLRALENYFSSPDLTSHTLADLCVRFPSFLLGQVDRYKGRPKSLDGLGRFAQTRNTENNATVLDAWVRKGGS